MTKALADRRSSPEAAEHPARAKPFSFTECLRERYGEAADPCILLGDQAPTVDPVLLDARLHGLAARTAAATRYTVLGEIARGGMALILKVWDADLQRPLAMKVAPSSDRSAGETSNPQELERLHRFLAEAQITAQLDHQGIVPVHDIGINADGDVYFTMGLIEGRDLGEIIRLARRDEQGWRVTRALAAIVKVCETVAYAHSRGVIHRDLKPTNVLVGKFGRVYVMDWGLAKVLGRRDHRDLRIRPRVSASGSAPAGPDEPVPPSVTPLMTLDGSVLGTPSYMSPEQALGHLDDVGPRSDVYAVGAMLYTLLTGRMPHVKPEGQVSPRAILLAVRNGPPAPVAELDPGAPAELVAICEKAMARKIEERYADMNALSEDLNAYLERRVVAVCRTGMLARCRKWAARNRSLAGGLAAALTVAAAAGIGASRLRARLEGDLQHARGELVTARTAAAVAARAGYAAHLAAADAHLRTGDVTAARRHLGLCPEDLRGWEWEHLNARTHGEHAVWRVRGHEGGARAIAFGPDGRVLVSGGADGAVRVWDVILRRAVRTLRGHDGEVRGVAFGPGGWIASGGADRTVRLWEAAGDDDDAVGPVVLRGHEGAVNAVAFAGEGRLVSGADDATLRLWEAPGGRPLRTLLGHESAVIAVASSPDGARLASASRDGTLRLWNGETADEIRVASRPGLAALALSGDLLAAASAGGDVELHEAASGRTLGVLQTGEGGVSSLALGPGPGRLATGAEDGGVRLREREGGFTLLALPGQGGRITAIAFSPPAAALAAASADGTLTIREGKPAQGRRPTSDVDER